MKKFSPLLMAFALYFCTTLNVSAQTAVYLNVKIEDQTTVVNNQTVLTPGISSDGNGLYTHGNSGITALFTDNGYLNFVSGSRIVKALYPSKEPRDTTSTDGTNSLAGFLDSKSNVQILTFVSPNPLQNMPVGSDVRCEGLAVNIDLGGAYATKRTIGYRAGRGTLSNTGFVKITHPDENTWYIEADTTNTCSSFSSIARIRDSKNKGKPAPDVDYGRYKMPLKMVLTRR